MDAKLRTAARRFALDHPGYVAEVALRNLPRLFNLGGASFERQVAAGDYGLGTRWATLMTVGLLPFLLLAVIGIGTVPARQAPRWLWAIPALMLSTIGVLASNRFRASIDPFVLMLAALGALALGKRLVPAHAARE